MKILLKAITFILIIFVFGCSKTKALPDFNKVEYYSLPEKDTLFERIYEKRYQNLTALEKEYLEIRDSDNPSSLIDSLKFSKLEKINFRKKTISSNKFDDLQDIFYSETCSPFTQKACAPIYRDIYIFKNNSTVVAIAKVCFECEILYYVDSKSKWQKSGDCVEFDKLREIK